ncbi:MAG TPA: hypothetical protein VEU62_21075 [Bryobacterales bacterium]|nr:hypothetical protein [Bryobacterales bacterium]
MPGEPDLAKKLGARPETSGTPIVACSASLARLERAGEMQISFADFLFNRPKLWSCSIRSRPT